MYLSKSKINTAIPESSTSYTPAISASGSLANPHLSSSLSLNKTTVQRNDRQLIKSFLDFMQDNDRITVENRPEEGKYFLFTCRAACGTAWPWSGSTQNMKNVAWWVGEKNGIRVMAFGSVNNIIGQGQILIEDTDGNSTWWPSRADSYVKLLEHLSEYVNSNSENPKLGDYQLSGLFSEVFNSGVRRGEFIHSEGNYTILLRVDAVINDDEFGCHTTVMGSPVFVLR